MALQARGMQKLVRTLVTSLPALANVGGVMLIFFFMFAVIGVNLFAGIKQGEALDGHANFNTFSNAMLLLFRCPPRVCVCLRSGGARERRRGKAGIPREAASSTGASAGAIGSLPLVCICLFGRGLVHSVHCLVSHK